MEAPPGYPEMMPAHEFVRLASFASVDSKAAITARMKRAYGGILINEAARVLLRKPRGLHKTRVWTFAKGKQEDGETDEQTALREVFEETGVRGKIIAKVPIPPEERGIPDEYFLMVPIEETGRFDEETVATVWASKDEANELISMTEDPERRQRDLKILQFAFGAYASLRGSFVFPSAADTQL
jgi:8-oxo-dGTP pyrophosphatase MutT (NUDIX family)